MRDSIAPRAKLLIGAALLSAACAPPAHDSASRAPLTAGSASVRSAVVAVTDSSGNILGATGTLVGRNAVLTSASAVTGVPPIALRVVFTSDLGSPMDRRYGVAEVFVDPMWFGGPEHDLALLRLTSAPTEAAPLPTPTGAPGSIGESVVLVGFGQPSVGGPTEAVRREAGATIARVTPETWTLDGPSWPCAGDSGAPMLVDEAGTTVVGAIVSEGDCMTRGLGPTLSASAAFIDDTLALIEAASPDGGPPPDAPRIRDAPSDAPAPAEPAPGGCHAGASQPAGALWLIVAAALLARRRRVREGALHTGGLAEAHRRRHRSASTLSDRSRRARPRASRRTRPPSGR